MITITLNGKPREVPSQANVTLLLENLKVNPKQVAVAVNGEVVPRATWGETPVRHGDIVEVVRAVGGGAPQAAR